MKRPPKLKRLLGMLVLAALLSSSGIALFGFYKHHDSLALTSLVAPQSTTFYPIQNHHHHHNRQNLSLNAPQQAATLFPPPPRPPKRYPIDILSLRCCWRV